MAVKRWIVASTARNAPLVTGGKPGAASMKQCKVVMVAKKRTGWVAKRAVRGGTEGDRSPVRSKAPLAVTCIVSGPGGREGMGRVKNCES